MPYVYLSEAEITQINRSVGGVTTINAGGLTAAAQGPAAGFAGVDLRPTLADKAATLIIEISQGHPFNDANKRTATEALDQFIKRIAEAAASSVGNTRPSMSSISAPTSIRP